MHLQWKKSGRSECGKYKATRTGAYYFVVTHAFGESVTQILNSYAESAADNRAICQRHAWKIASQQAINYVCHLLTTPDENGGAILSHALKVDSSQVSRWKLGRALVPGRHCQLIAEFYRRVDGGKLELHELRPDLEFYRDMKTNALNWRKRSAIVGGGEQ